MFREPAWIAAAALALPAAAALLAWAAARRRKVAAALGREATLARVAEDAVPRRRLAGRLRLAALALVFAALAGPRWGVELVQTTGSARQVVVAVDVSLSMRARDVKPSRLERAKASLSLLLDQLQGDRVGVVAFAGDAQVLCPLTTDVDAAKELLGALDVGAVPTPGTAIGSAIRTAAAMIGRYPGAKSIVLLTDGEDHRSDPLGAAREAAAAGVKLYAVGIGTPEGEPIPLEEGGYKKDARGATVVSRLGEETLAAAAKETGGAYYRSSPGEDEIAEIAAQVKSGGAARGLSGTAARWRDHYAWPLALAFLLLLVEMALPLLPPARPAAAKESRRAAKAGALALVLLAAAAGARAASFEGTLRDANKRYADGRYDDALELYGDASGRRPSDPRPVFNAGDALFRLDRDSEAAGAFGSVADAGGLPRPLRAAAYYNLGDARYRAGDYAGAADAYRRALALAPRDADARRNLAVALRSRKSPPSKDQQKKNQSQSQKNNPPPQPQKSQGGGQSQPQPPRTRPQESMPREDAERVLRAVAEREKAAQRAAGSPAASWGRRRPPPPSPTGEDW